MGSIEDNKALVRRFYAEIDARNIAAMDELVMTRIRARRTFAEDMGDIPATGGEMDVTATAVHRSAVASS